MLSNIYSATNIGLNGFLIKVEVDVYERGLPSFTIVGLPNKAIEESKERVKTAIKNSSFKMPDTRIVVNLAPADIPKEGSLFDLPIAIGILASAGYVEKDIFNDAIFIGELSLDGKLRSIKGLLPIIYLAKKLNINNVFLPKDNVLEANFIEGVNVYGIDNLAQLILHLNKNIILSPDKSLDIKKLFSFKQNSYDFQQIKGQYLAKRALEIASCGFHNVHLSGPPGAGKTLLAKSFCSILPALDQEEMFEIANIYSVSGFDNKKNIYNRPFRSPHHTTSRVGLIGGGSDLSPGEISLAHRGVLFLDEFCEFPRSTLEALRQPLEDGEVTISRAKGSITYPARFVLLAASNPCPCGYLGHPKIFCKCTSYQIDKYKKRISGPIIDRIDIHINVFCANEHELMEEESGENSDTIKTRIEVALEIQKQRFKKTKIKNNSEMSSSDIRQFCKLEDEANELLKNAINKFSLSTRVFFKVIKVAQTIADLDNSLTIKKNHLAESLSYRPNI